MPMAREGGPSNTRLTKTKKKEDEGRKQGVDRLSSLPDDILIEILSRICLHRAISTGCLSTRWRGLWKNITSVNITIHNSKNMSEVCGVLGNVMSQIKSPFIDRISVRLSYFRQGRYPHDWMSLPPYGHSWLRRICNRNIRELKVKTWNYSGPPIMKLPSLIFQTSSLVSIKLGSYLWWQLPSEGDPINLPNLKNLSLSIGYDNQCHCLDKLIEACPSLEELSLNFRRFESSLMPVSFKCSNRNLNRLTMKLSSYHRTKVAIDAPKLEYLAISAPMSYSDNAHNEKVDFYGPIYSVRFLAVDIYALQKMSTVFSRVTQVTLDMKISYSIKNMLSLMKFCPVLDALSLKCSNFGDTDKQASVLQKDALLRGLKRITIETSFFHHHKPHKSFLELVEYLLSNAIDLTHFRFRLDGNQCYNMRQRAKRRELKLCKLLYHCPTVSVGCEVEFEGVILNMSRKAGPKAWSRDGKVIPFDNSPWNGFVYIR